MQFRFMEDNVNMNSSNDNINGDENRIVQKFQRTNMSRRRKRRRKNNLFWYDIRNIPDSLLIEILSRLPVKSIFQFKSVCKHWQTLISHPSFPRFYHSILNSNAAALPFRILDRYTCLPNFKEFVNTLAPEIDSLCNFSVLFLSSPKEQAGPSDQFRVLDMSNGLILCCSRSSTPFVYYICDPLTRLWVTIPRRAPDNFDLFCEGLITRVNEDHILTGYTVVRVELFGFRSNYVNLEMFSSETGKWIVYKLPCAIPILLREDIGPIHCSGALHWPVSLHYADGTHAMLAFDPYKDPKSVRLIPLPKDRNLSSEDRDGGYFQLCDESQGTLRYLEAADSPTKLYLLKMWVMKDYEKGEWCCEFKVRRSDIHSSNMKLSKWLLRGCFCPLSFHPLNQNVVYLWCMERPQWIVSYDVLNRRLDVACKPIDIDKIILSYSSIPFVLPRWPVLVSIANVNSKRKGVKCRK